MHPEDMRTAEALCGPEPEPHRTEAGPGLDDEPGHHGGRQPGEDDDEPSHWYSSGADFLAAVDEPVRYVLNELIPCGQTILTFGEPRVRKTWLGIELVVAAASATPPFGLERFAPPEAVPAMYVSEEDGAPRVRERLRQIVHGRGLATSPPGLYVAVHAGINLEDPAWQDRMLTDVRRLGLRLLVLDPMRRCAPSTDKGPAEVRAVTGFIRRLASETGCAVAGQHHVVKPARDGRDDRRAAHRASGGDWFAATDCPISMELIGQQTLVTPTSYKFGPGDPRPFRFRIEPHGSGLRLLGEDCAGGEDARDLALDEELLDWLSGHRGASTKKVEDGLKGHQRQAVRDALERLQREGKVDSTEGPRRARLWFVSAS